MTTSTAAVLQALLAAEHAAIHAYGVLGARLAGPGQAAAGRAEDAHRGARDALVGLLRARGADLPAPRPSYGVAVADERAALELAVQVEEGLAVRWRDLVGGTDDRALRRLATAGLVDAAVRAARWRAATGAELPTVPLPGDPDGRPTVPGD